MARHILTLVGNTPLVMHNPQLADPEHAVTKQIKTFTSKRKKTEEDQRAIGRLEWEGGLYRGEDGAPAIPTANVRKCLIEAGKTRKLGKQIGRAVVFVDFMTPLVYDGPKDIEKLYSRPEFRLRRTVVNNGQTRIVRVRPQFPTWMLSTQIELLEDMLNPDELKDIADLAGLIEGLGDARNQGFGRFLAEVKAA